MLGSRPWEDCGRECGEDELECGRASGTVLNSSEGCIISLVKTMVGLPKGASRALQLA